MTAECLAERRAEALHFLRAETMATESQRMLAWRFMKQDRERRMAEQESAQ
jgi:hypothetical protein